MRHAMLVPLFALLLACAGAPQRNPVPLEALERAEIAGFEDVRSWGHRFSPHFQADLVRSIRDEPPGLFPRDPDGSLAYAALALSGGGQNGAFGAGFLNGWSSTGKRPVFKLVTGVSTGALIAPLAFLGEAYDDLLKSSYTEITQQDVYEERGKLTAFGRGALADTAPLRRLLEQTVTAEVLAEIARAHDRGRRLYVGTTHLDAQAIMIWNMGAIAASGHPDALRLFHEVLLASASIPVLFPPVLFDVTVDGEPYDELHVDGGVISQVFVYGAMLDVPAAVAEVHGSPPPGDRSTLYIIRNGKIAPDAEQVSPKLVPIAVRTIASMSRAGLWGDTYRIFAIAQRDGIGFRFVSVPNDYEQTSDEPYDPEDMRRLFDIGFDLAVAGDRWKNGPPGFE